MTFRAVVDVSLPPDHAASRPEAMEKKSAYVFRNYSFKSSLVVLICTCTPWSVVSRPSLWVYHSGYIMPAYFFVFGGRTIIKTHI